MKSQIDYGAWINDKHVEMTRKHWLAAWRLTFTGESIEGIKKEIFRVRQKASRLPLYFPGVVQNYDVPHVCAYYHTSTNRSHWYVQNYGKETAVVLAVSKWLNLLGIDYRRFEDLDLWDDDISTWESKEYQKCGLDPAWEPTRDCGRILIDELHDINYHTLADDIEKVLEERGE